eukprot:1393037-Amphidinium_carterae.1
MCSSRLEEPHGHNIPICPLHTSVKLEAVEEHALAEVVSQSVCCDCALMVPHTLVLTPDDALHEIVPCAFPHAAMHGTRDHVLHERLVKVLVTMKTRELQDCLRRGMRGPPTSTSSRRPEDDE